MSKYTASQVDTDRDNNNFRHHAPINDQAERYVANREACHALSKVLRANCPPSRELSLAMTALEEVCFWGNSAIARNE